MRDRLMLEYPEKMCEYCCNFDKEHIGMDGMALCKLTMTLAYAEDYGGNCMFYNVPKEQIIVPPCKVGEKINGEIVYEIEYKEYLSQQSVHKEAFVHTMNKRDLNAVIFCSHPITWEEAEKALAERSGE